ncbi:Ldh family oxidoreductase [Geodermatophilus sp. SYSU D00703]
MTGQDVGEAPEAATVDLAAIRDWAAAVLVASGLSAEDAGPVADSLAFAESRGVATHGFLRLPTYIARIKHGGISREARVTTVLDQGALVVIDAGHGPGARTGLLGADLAVERARRFGVGCVIARNASHFGASAFFTERIADKGLLGVALCNTEAVMCAPFGGRPVLGTNPIALTVPVPEDRRPQLDMATTTVSQGKLIMAEQAGEDIPLGWAVDARGRPTTSPTAGLAGALLPSGGPKGFGLAFAVDALLALGGSEVSPAVSALNGDHSVHQRLGHFFLAIRADGAEGLTGYRRRIEQLVDAVHRSGLDGETPMVPGEPELARVAAGSGRVHLREELLAVLYPLAASTGVPLPSPADTARPATSVSTS